MPDPERQIPGTPEVEDFRGKYESGRVGQTLLNGYFRAVGDLLSHVDNKDDRRWIEIGCGEGLSTKRLIPLLHEGVEFEASEYLHDQVISAKHNNPGLRIFRDSVYQLAHEAGTFQVVFLLEVLEHLEHPGPALKEVARVLEPGGYLIAGVPREPLWRVLNMARGKYLRKLGNTPGHLNHWSKRSFVDYVTASFGPVVATRAPIPWTLVLARRPDFEGASGREDREL